MTVRGPYFATPHAVRRYMERHRPDLTYEEARDELVRAAASAHVVATTGETAVLRTGRRYGRIRIVTGFGRGSLRAIVTVLDAGRMVRRPC